MRQKCKKVLWMHLQKKEILVIILLVAIAWGVTIPAVTALPQTLTKILSQAKHAFFSDSNLITGELVAANVSATVGNAAPVAGAIVLSTGADTIPAQSVTEDGIKDVYVNFYATDANGASDINVSSRVNLTLVNETGSGVDTSYNTSCYAELDVDGTTANFSCSVEIHYWYAAGTWNITAAVNDAAGLIDENRTNFTLSETTAFAISPEGMTFPGLTLGAENVTSDNDPIVVNNTANDYIDSNNVRIAGLDLVGEVTDSIAITTANFTVAPFNGDSPPQECVNTALVNNTATGINSTDLAAGNKTIANTAVENLYICLNIVPTGLTAQTYSTVNGTVGWVVSVV